MHYLTLFLIAALLTLATACEKEPLDLLDELVPATQEGANILGCLIDGEVFYNRGGSISTRDYFAGYGTVGGEKISLGGFDYNNPDYRAIVVKLFIAPPKEGNYLPTTTFVGIVLKIEGEPDDDFTVSLDDFEAVITRFDKTARVISGTFEFTATSIRTQQIVRITEGRFDMRYF